MIKPEGERKVIT